MSVKINQHLVDDLAYRKDPNTDLRADMTLRFAVGGDHYEIDLSEKNAEAFRKKLAPYMQAGRRLKAKHAGPRTGRRRSGDIRAWAKQSGIQVNDRGRIPVAVIEQYEQAVGRKVA